MLFLDHLKYIIIANIYIRLHMSYFQGIFLPQTHKTRSGYYLNHDILMSGRFVNLAQFNKK
jgi:hypothetical protein